MAFIVVKKVRPTERVPISMRALHGLNFPHPTKARHHSFLPSYGTRGKEGGVGLECYQGSNIKNGVRVFITDTVIILSLW